MNNYDGSWHGGKGSRPRKIDKGNYDSNYNRAFKSLSWLDRKIILEAWRN